MAEKDVVSKTLLRRILVDIAEYLLGLPLREAELMETEQPRVEDRRSDLTARVVDEQGRRFILHLEIQNDNRANMPDRMLRYLTDIRLEHPGEAVHQYLIYIGQRPLSMPDGLDTHQLRYRYRVVDMHSLDYADLLAHNSADAVVLAILADFKSHAPERVVRELINRLFALTGDDGQTRREYLKMLEILAGNRGLVPLIEEVYETMRVEIENLPSYRIGRKYGLQEHAEAVARRLLERGMAVEDIAEIAELPLADVIRLRDEQASTPH